jgi:ribonuclease J
MLSADGIFIVVATLDSDDGSQVAAPEVIFRGVPFLEQEETSELVDELRGVVEGSLARAADDGVTEPVLLQEDLHDDIAAFVYERLRRRPMILPVVVEV